MAPQAWWDTSNYLDSVITNGYEVLSFPRQQSGQRPGVQQQSLVFLRHKLQRKMAIKARPYGGKPGIAVAKETESCLLTVWPIKLWGAVTPVAPWTKKKVRKIEVKHGGKETISVIHVQGSRKSSHRPISGSVHGDFPPGGRDALVNSVQAGGLTLTQQTVRRQLRNRFINQLFALATKPWIFSLTLHQLAASVTSLWPVSFFCRSCNPPETFLPWHLTSPLLGDN